MDEITGLFLFSPWLQALFLLPFLLYLFLILWFLRGWVRMPVYDTPCEEPAGAVTVIVPCRNEEKNLPSLLGMLGRQSYPAALTTILLVDDHSADTTWQVMQRLALDHRNIRVLKNRDRGKKMALLTALEDCRTEWVVTTDADARPHPEWLSVMMGYRKKSGAELVAGAVMTTPGKGLLSSFRELEGLGLLGAGMGAAATGHPLYCYGANLLYRKALPEEDPDPLRKNVPSGDDVFLLHTVKKKDPRLIRFLKSRKGTVFVTEKEGAATFFRQRMRWASKGPAYRDRDTLVTASLVLLVNLLLVAVFVTGIFFPGWWPFVLALWGIKSLPDFLLLYGVAAFYRRRELLWVYPVALVFYPFYVTFVALAGIFSYPFRGKGWGR